jgi:hypothetical protein
MLMMRIAALALFGVCVYAFGGALVVVGIEDAYAVSRVEFAHFYLWRRNGGVWVYVFDI